MDDQNVLRKNGTRLIETLKENGYEGYFVGGCVRDTIMGRQFTDVDIATSALPDETRRIFTEKGFSVIDIGIKHGTVAVICDSKPYEITTYRIDGEYKDCRHPEKVSFTRDILLDLSRRDFTVNAMAMDCEGRIIDPFGGVEDIKNGVIRAVGDAEKRFEEDALRILRGCRFSSVLGFSIEKNTFDAMKKLAHLMQRVAGERLFAEFYKLITGKNSGLVLYNCRHIIDKMFFPYSFSEKLDRYSKYLFVGAMNCVEVDFSTKAAAFICICGGEENRASEFAKQFIKRTKCDKKTANDVIFLVSSVFSPLILTKKEMNHCIVKWGEKLVFSVFSIREGLTLLDILPFDALHEKSLAVARHVLEVGTVTTKNLAINGNDLYNIGVKKGIETGEMLAYLVDMVAEGYVKNEKNELIRLVLSKNINK